MEKDIENIKFGQRVASLRRESGITQEELSLKCNINRTYMGEIERGEKSPSLTIIVKIAKGLNVSKKTLLDYE